MSRGGVRAGAGRKAFCSKTIPVHWRVSERAKEWITRLSEELGEPKGVIIDELIDSYEEQARK